MVDNNAKLFAITSLEKLDVWRQLEVLMTQWRKVERFAATERAVHIRAFANGHSSGSLSARLRVLVAALLKLPDRHDAESAQAARCEDSPGRHHSR